MGDGVGEMVVADLVARDAPHGPRPDPGHSHLRFPERILDHVRLRSPRELIDGRTGDDAYVYHGLPVSGLGVRHARKRPTFATHSSAGNTSSFRTQYLTTLTLWLPIPYKDLNFPSAVLLRVEQLQHLLCAASDEHATACRVHCHAVRLSDGRVAGDLARHAAIEGEVDNTVLGGEGNPQLIPPRVYG